MIENLRTLRKDETDHEESDSLPPAVPSAAAHGGLCRRDPAPAQAEGAAGTSAPTAPAAPAESAPLAESAAPTATAAQEGTFAILHTATPTGVQERSGDSIGYPLLRSLADNTRSAYETLLLDSGNALEGDGSRP